MCTIVFSRGSASGGASCAGTIRLLLRTVLRLKSRLLVVLVLRVILLVIRRCLVLLCDLFASMCVATKSGSPERTGRSPFIIVRNTLTWSSRV